MALTKGRGLTSKGQYQEAEKLYRKASKVGSPVAESRLLGVGLAELLKHLPKELLKTSQNNPEVREKLKKTATAFYEEVKEFYESMGQKKIIEPSVNTAFYQTFSSLPKMMKADFPLVKACINGKEKWLIKAAEQGHVEVQFRLGAHYRKKGNLHKAEEWLEKAANQGDANSLYLLGTIYSIKSLKHTTGTHFDVMEAERNQQKAIELYQKAANQGSEDAKKAYELAKKRLEEIEITKRLLARDNSGEILDFEELYSHYSK
ncbi:MAG TPA: tetratricopeptide repeat protein [Alphaproteobacteria bacterium]|nr:tetratricopeptide repeat protein [Alphaproteobacteria bacterium]